MNFISCHSLITDFFYVFLLSSLSDAMALESWTQSILLHSIPLLSRSLHLPPCSQRRRFSLPDADAPIACSSTDDGELETDSEEAVGSGTGQEDDEEEMEEESEEQGDSDADQEDDEEEEGEDISAALDSQEDEEGGAFLVISCPPPP